MPEKERKIKERKGKRRGAGEAEALDILLQPITPIKFTDKDEIR